MKQVDQGYFVHRVPYSETSLVVTFFTLNHGLKSFLYQGAKKKQGGLNPLELYELEYYQRNDSQLAKLTKAQLFNTPTWNQDPIYLSVCYFLAEVIRQCHAEQQSDANYFTFIGKFLEKLQSQKTLKFAPLQFLAETTEFLGFYPNIDCENPQSFNMIDGEFHRHDDLSSATVFGESAKQLFYLFTGRFDEITDKNLLLDDLLRYYQLHVPRFNVSKQLRVIQDLLYG